MNESNQLWNRTQVEANLSQLEQYITNPCFKRNAVFTDQTQSIFIQLVLLETDVLEQARQAGKRIDFLEEVGTNGRIEDITSLLSNVKQLLYDFTSSGKTNGENTTIIRPDFNHFYGAGTGYFSNGLFFICPHEDELAFFVGRNRLYFYRHIVRAFTEAKAYLQAMPHQ